jgi:hypothetical protein
MHAPACTHAYQNTHIQWGHAPLHIAAALGRIKVIKFLLEQKNVRINLRTVSACVSVHTPMLVRVFMCVCMFVCKFVCVCVCIYIYIYIGVYMYVCIYTYVCVCVCMYVYDLCVV